MATRGVKRLVKSKPTVEGAGVRLRRAFGFGTTEDYDPFLLLDDFRSDRPEDYLAGFPWHPRRSVQARPKELCRCSCHRTAFDAVLSNGGPP